MLVDTKEIILVPTITGLSEAWSPYQISTFCNLLKLDYFSYKVFLTRIADAAPAAILAMFIYWRQSRTWEI